MNHLFDVELGTPRWPERPRYLMSYAYVDDSQVQLCRDHDVDLVVDSGAFTTAASGKQMDHDGYLAWLRDNEDAITFALSYDVIGDPKASWENHVYGQDRVGDIIQLVPTYHLGTPLSELARLCKFHPLVCIGGAVPFARQPHHLSTVLKQIHRIAADHGTKLHGLGMTGNKVIRGLPWDSVDSSAWLAPVRFPSLPLADHEGRIVQMEHGAQLTHFEEELVARYGGDVDLVQTPGWLLSDPAGPNHVAIGLREWTLKATARSYMHVEAAKNGGGNPLRLYLSGNAGVVDGAVGVIVRAHAMGTPYPETNEYQQEELFA